MHINLVLDIIQKGVEELKQITDNFKTDTPNSLEIDIATAKTETLLKELHLLQDKLQGKISSADISEPAAIGHSAADKTQKKEESIHSPIYKEEKEQPKTVITAKKEYKATEKKLSPSKDINELININDKFQFTRELFDNNTYLYNDTINKLNAASSFENAKKIISSFNWNEEEETVIHFTEILTRKFN